jgi:hypothetical protein
MNIELSLLIVVVAELQGAGVVLIEAIDLFLTQKPASYATTVFSVVRKTTDDWDVLPEIGSSVDTILRLSDSPRRLCPGSFDLK